MPATATDSGFGIVAPVNTQSASPDFSAIRVHDAPSSVGLAWISSFMFITGRSARLEASMLTLFPPARLELIRFKAGSMPFLTFGKVPIAASSKLGIWSRSGSAFEPLTVASNCSAVVNCSLTQV